MADQLDLYNDALLLLGQRQLNSLAEEREPRYRLDGAFNREAINYCLELVKPHFANRTQHLTLPASADTFDFSHDLPNDYVSMVMPFSDKKLDQEINRYVIEGNKLLADYDSIYLRYVGSVDDINAWTPSFLRVMGAYLARETATRLSPDEYDKLELKFKERVKSAQGIESSKTPVPRASASTVSLTNEWRHIYNDALQILGLPEINANDDDSDRRVKLDRALDAGLVEDLLEDTGWQFGQETMQINFDPSSEPAFGHRYAFPKPADLHRIDGLYTDEHLQCALDRYDDEGGFFFCGYQTIYLVYIKKSYLTNPANWPNYFRRYVAAQMAKDAAPSLVDQKREDRVLDEFETRKSSAMSTDAMQSPPRLIAEGNWVRSRYRGNFRGRP